MGEAVGDPFAGVLVVFPPAPPAPPTPLPLGRTTVAFPPPNGGVGVIGVDELLDEEVVQGTP